MNQTNASPTLNALFQRILARKPDAIALVDPLNKPKITGQPPRRLTFAQADRAISALAAHFIDAGLPTHSVIAIQLPNTIEFMLTVLAAHRAGLVVDLAIGVVRLNALLLDIVGGEAEDVGFLEVHPDDGVAVRHGTLRLGRPAGSRFRASASLTWRTLPRASLPRTSTARTSSPASFGPSPRR